MIATLKIGEESFKLLTCEYEFYNETNSQGRPCSPMLGGDIKVSLDSSADTDFTLLEKMSRQPYEFISGKIEIFDEVKRIPHRSIEFEDAFISNYDESTKVYESIPMMVTLCITPQRFNIARSFCVDRSKTGWWRTYIPEDTPTYLSGTEDPEPAGECTVYFRRTADYDGSFGFDWLRTGDTDEAGCGWYKDIMPSVDDYDKLSANEYLHFTQPWRLQYGKYKSTATYMIPWVTLMEGCTAKFRVKVCVNEPSGKLRFKTTGSGSQMLSLSYDSAEATTVGDYYIKDLEVKCIGPIGVTSLEVYAGGDLVGKMMFLPNHKMYPVDVAVITVKTQGFHNKTPYMRKPDSEILEGVARLLGQAYIIPNFVHYELDTNEIAEGYMESSQKNSKKIIRFNLGEILRTAKVPYEYKDASLLENLYKNNDEKRINTNSETGKKFFPSFHNFLNYILYTYWNKEKEFESAPVNLCKIYFINEDAGAGGTKNGEAKSEENAAVIFRNGYNKETITHEILHCLSLSHIFPDKTENDKNKKYIFEKYATDNIMDYVKDGDPADKRKSLWYWQIKQLWEKLK